MKSEKHPEGGPEKQEHHPARPLAVILKGDPRYVDGEPNADAFYSAIVGILTAGGLDVVTLPGVPGVRPDRTHPLARVWIGHSLGTERLRFAPPGARTLMLGVVEGLHHPDDDACTLLKFPRGWRPKREHYVLTFSMLSELLSLIAWAKGGEE